MKKNHFFLIIFVTALIAGCATPQPKPRTFGDKVGEGIDWTIEKTSQGIQKLINRQKDY